MALMTRTRLTMAAYKCHYIFEELAKKLESPTLIDAVDSYDSDTVDDILEKSLCKLLETDSLRIGLEKYCEKFGIGSNFKNMDCVDIIIYIDNHTDEILQQLESVK